MVNVIEIEKQLKEMKNAGANSVRIIFKNGEWIICAVFDFHISGTKEYLPSVTKSGKLCAHLRRVVETYQEATSFVLVRRD